MTKQSVLCVFEMLQYIISVYTKYQASWLHWGSTNAKSDSFVGREIKTYSSNGGVRMSGLDKITLSWSYMYIQIKRIFHGIMVRIGKVEPEGWPVRSGPSFSEVQKTGLPEGSTFPILTNDPVIDYFFAYQLLLTIWRRNSTFSTRLRRMTLCCYAALLRYVAEPEVVHALRWQSELHACVLCW